MKTFKEFIAEGFVNSKDKNLTKDEILELPVGSEFYHNSYTAKKISPNKVKIKYPMKPAVSIPIDQLKGLNEAVVHNSNNKLQLKAGGSEILITTKGNNVNIFVQEGSERIMFEGKSDDLKAIKDFFSNI
jgi:hypothetical protein